jgi:hypothetical protein
MRLCLALLIAALSLPAPAADTPNAADDAKSRQKMKERLLRHVEARIRALEELHACIGAAADMKAIGDCHEQERKKAKALREEARAETLAPR